MEVLLASAGHLLRNYARTAFDKGKNGNAPRQPRQVDTLPEEASINADSTCAGVTSSQPTTSALTPSARSRHEGTSTEARPYPAAARFLTQPQWQCQTSRAVWSCPCKRAHQVTSNSSINTPEFYTNRRLLHPKTPLRITDLIVGGVGPNRRPDLCVGTRPKLTLYGVAALSSQIPRNRPPQDLGRSYA